MNQSRRDDLERFGYNLASRMRGWYLCDAVWWKGGNYDVAANHDTEEKRSNAVATFGAVLAGAERACVHRLKVLSTGGQYE